MTPAELTALFARAPAPADHAERIAENPSSPLAEGFAGWLRHGKPARWRIACRATSREECEAKLLDHPLPPGVLCVDRLVLPEGEKPWDIYR